MLDANFWHDKANSKIILKEKKLLGDLIQSHDQSIKKLEDLNELNQLAVDENNLVIQNEVLDEIRNLRSKVKKNEIKCFLSNEADPLDCYIEIHAGAGGTES